MQRMWKTNWLSGVSYNAEPSVPGPAPSQGDPPNLLRPTFSPDKPVAGLIETAPPGAAKKPDLSGALDAVGRAADLIRAAQARAVLAEEQIRVLQDESADRVKLADEEIKALRERARMAESALQFVTGRTEEALSQADAEILSLRTHARAEAERARAVELRSTAQLTAAEKRLKEADARIVAAEARAEAASQDLACLAATIRERFSIETDGLAVGKPNAPGLGSLLPRVA